MNIRHSIFCVLLITFLAITHISCYANNVVAVEQIQKAICVNGQLERHNDPSVAAMHNIFDSGNDSPGYNRTLAKLEANAVNFLMKSDVTSEIHISTDITEKFDVVNCIMRIDYPVQTKITLQLTDSMGISYSLTQELYSRNWNTVSFKIEDLKPSSGDISIRSLMPHLPIRDIKLIFEPQKMPQINQLQIKLHSLSFSNLDPKGDLTYPYGNYWNNIVRNANTSRLDYYDRLLPKNLSKNDYFFKMVYECGDDRPYTCYDHTDKFQIAEPNDNQLAFKSDDGLSLVAKNKDDVFWGYYRFGTIETDKIRLYGGEIIGIEYSAAGLTAASSLRIWIETTDGSQITLNVGVPLNVDGKRHLFNFKLPAHYEGKRLLRMGVKFTNPSVGWGELNLHTISILARRINNRIDADNVLTVPPKHDVRVATPNGVPVITIDGNPISAMGFANQSTRQASNKYWDAMLNQTGYTVPLGRVVIPATEDIYLLASPHIWVGPDQFDYSYIDEQMNRVTKASPQSVFMIYLQIEGNKWWNYLHPESAGNDERRGVPDYLSDEWKHAVRDMLRQIIAHIQSQPYGEKIIGYQIWGGSSLDTNLEINDATPAALKRFRQFLRQKYKTSNALQNAWKQLDVTFDSARPDPMFSMMHPYDRQGMTLLIDPGKRRAYLDRYEFRSMVYQQMLIDLCSIIKEATHDRALTGSRTGNFIGGQWFGFSKGFPDTNYEPNIDLLIKSPVYDIFELQEPYPGRSLGYDGGIGTPNIPTLGAAMHHKLIMVQDDYPWGYDTEVSMEEHRNHIRRVYSHAIMTGLYPYEWCVGESHYTFNKPQLIDEYKIIAPVFEKAIKVNRGSVAQVAMICDTDYKKYIGYDPLFNSPPRTVALYDVARYTLTRAGMPFDMIFMDQIASAKPYKIYIFFHTYELSSQKRAMIEKIVRDNGGVAIFIWADFLMGSNGMDVNEMSNAIGMKLRMDESLHNFVLDPTSWFTAKYKPSDLYPLGDITRFQNQGWQPGKPVPSDNVYSPRFIVTDPEATNIAYYKGSREVAVASKKLGNGWVIYCGSTTLSPSLLRYASDLSGAFQYIDTEDAFMTNESFVCIHAGKTQDIKLDLPKSSALYDVYSDKEYPQNVQFELNVEKDKTYLLYKGSRASWMAIPK